MENEKKKVDWLITLLPLAIVVACMCASCFLWRQSQSNEVLSKVRFFFGDTMGTYYLSHRSGHLFALHLHCLFQVWLRLFLVRRTKSQSTPSLPGDQ